MLRHRRAGGPDRGHEAGHVVLPVAQQPHQPQTGAVGEHPQRGDRRVDLGGIRKDLLHRAGTCRVVACVHEHIQCQVTRHTDNHRGAYR